MIVWEGSIQARVERRNPVTREIESYWLDTLEKGACISVFRCFDNSRSLVNYYASSKKVAVDFISANDLEDMARQTIALNDRLSVIKLRIKNKMVDDIDYFTYPKRLLEQNLEQWNEQARKSMLESYKEAKTQLINEMLSFV